jgi:GPH family glycoside/pentoside/hexuronide:cation symporter
VTYLAFGAVYSGINTPYGILGNLITTNAQARVSLSSYRMTGSMIGILLISMLTLPMVHWLGGGESRASEAAGFPRFMAIVAVFGSALWLVVIKFCRIRATPAENHHNMRELCGALARNRPWLVANLLFALNFFNICGLVSFTIYFAKVVIGRSVEFGGFLLTICTIASLLGTMTVPYLCHWFGRRRTLLLSFVVQIAAWLVVFATAGRSEAYLPALLLASFVLGFSAPILYALLSDVIDYGTSTTGVRTAGLAYAINSLVQKVSFAAAGSFLAWLLDLGGYLPASATQPTSAAAAIMVGFVWVPVASCVLSILATFALPGDDQIRKHVAAVA